MKRLLSALATAAFVAVVSSGAFAMDSMKGGAMKGSAMSKCPAGQTWIKGYKKKDGTKVAGYCRKAKSSSMMKK